ncbi:MAG TPA: ABC transporter permease subunit [Phototrophicaceae bacterium]|nr:ABC transporter permease subunit [Phototrophicaceae bacterium]
MAQVALNQLRGMILYEFRMHWRRRPLLIMTLAFTLITVAAVLIAGDSLLKPNDLDVSTYNRVVTAYAIFTTWMPLGIGLVFILPVMVADTIPLDRQHGVRDLLDSLPVSRAVYLTGKLIGTWVAVLIGVGVGLFFCALVWRLRAGAFDVGKFAEMAIFGAGAIAVLNSSLGVLLAVGQPSRRRAIVVVTGFLTLFIFVLPLLMNNWDLRGSFNNETLNPIRIPIINYFMFNVQAEAGLGSNNPALLVSAAVVRDTILVGLVEIAVIWALAWGWLRWRGDRA